MQLHLDRIEVRLVHVPLGRPLATKIGHFGRWPLVLIDVQTREGITGSAYLTPYLDRSAVLIARALRDLSPEMSGEPLTPAQGRASLQRWFSLAGRQGLAWSAAAGLDMACWDALAKQASLPLARLVGGSTDPVAAYNSNGLGLIDPDAVADEAHELLAEGGFRALKIRVGRDDSKQDVQAIHNAREAVGPDIDLVADYNQGLDRFDASRRCREIDDLGLRWIEEPLRYDDLSGHAGLARDCVTPIMLGENFYGPRPMFDAIQAGACDMVMPDLMRIGGVSGWLQAAAIADVCRVPMGSHLFPEVSAHLMGVTPTGTWLEWQDWAHPILAEPFRIEDGHLHIPDTPGTGMSWDEDAVRHYAMDA